jgi:hypothetical protein
MSLGCAAYRVVVVSVWCCGVVGAIQLLGMIAWREKRLPEAEELLRKAIALKVGLLQLLFGCF